MGSYLTGLLTQPSTWAGLALASNGIQQVAASGHVTGWGVVSVFGGVLATFLNEVGASTPKS
jgi:hypothetical protein